MATVEKLHKDERETLINYSEIDGYWIIETFVVKHINACKKKGWEVLREDKAEDGTVVCAEFRTPASTGITIGVPVRKNPNKNRQFIKNEGKLGKWKDE